MLRFVISGIVALGVFTLGQLDSAAAQDTAKPQRIVSMNLCTDQLLMYLVEPERIYSVTYLSFRQDATPPEHQQVLDQAKVNHGLAEQILMMEPDLVLAGQYSTLTTTPLLQRLGYNVIVFSPENNFNDMRANIRKMGAAVGEPGRAEELIEAFDKELAELSQIAPAADLPIFADVGANYWMVGDNTLYASVVNAGGYRTLGQEIGYSGSRRVPLEQLIRYDIDLMSTKSPYEHPPSMATQSLNHPLLRDMKNTTPVLDIPSRYTVCATPASLEAARQLAKRRHDVIATQDSQDAKQ